jgi:AraC-like DNA-binding protein
MRDYPSSVPSFHLAGLISHLREHGEDVDAVLAKHRLSSAALALPDARLPRQVMASVLSALQSRTGREDLGFEMGLHSDLLQHPLLGRLLQSAGTLGEGIQRIAPYMPLITPSFRMQCEPGEPDWVVSWLATYPLPYEMARLAMETVLVLAHRTFRRLFANQRLFLHAKVSWAPPAHAHRYEALQDFRITYLAERDRLGASIEFSGASAAATLPRANAALWHETDQACSAQLQQLQARHEWSAWIAHILDAVEDHQPSQQELAGLMGISVRTLTRNLASEGVRFRDLALQIRHRRAQALLRDTPIPVSEITRMLGYSDSANFTRAFRSAAGVSPQAFRAQTR